MKKWGIGFLVICFVVLFAFVSQGQHDPKKTAELYDSATERFYAGKYEEALELYFQLIRSFPQSKLVSYSQFMIGQCYLKAERYDAAVEQFQLYLKYYPEGDRRKAAEEGLRLAEQKLKERVQPEPTPSPQEIKLSIPETPKGTTEEKVVTGRSDIAKDEVSPRGGSSGEAKPMEAKPSPIGKQDLPGRPPLSGEKPKRRIAVQIFYFDGNSFDEMERKMKELKEAGVDTLIVRVFQNKGDRAYKFVDLQSEEGVYFETEHAPVVADILGEFAEMAHRNGLEIFAWMTTRFANYGSDIPEAYRCRRYNFATKKVELAKGFNLFHPAVLERLKGLYRDLGRYPIDGILFQDDLILRHHEDFSPEATRAFADELGFEPQPEAFYIEPSSSGDGRHGVKGYTEKFWTWANWKSRRLMDVAQALMEAARESNPRLKFALNLYMETFSDSQNGVAHLSQSLAEVLKRGFDYYAVMAYHRQVMKELKIDSKQAMDLTAEVTRKAILSVPEAPQVMIKIQVMDWKSYEVVSRKEVERIVERVLEQGDVSLAFVPDTPLFPLHLLKKKWENRSR